MTQFVCLAKTPINLGAMVKFIGIAPARPGVYLVTVADAAVDHHALLGVALQTADEGQPFNVLADGDDVLWWTLTLWLFEEET